MIKVWEERNKYKLKVLYGKKELWIEEAVTDFSHSGSKEQASRTMTLNCAKSGGNTDFPIGSLVVIYLNSKELMRYIITKKNIKRSGTTIKYTCRDIRWWMTRSKIDKKFENKSASDIFKELCKICDIPMGEVEDTEFKFKTLHFLKKSPWDILITALTETRKRTGEKFITKVERGRLCLVKKSKQVRKWVIEESVNLIDSEYEESMEDMYTKVKVEGKTKKGKTITSIKSNAAMQKQYGIMQEYISQSDSTTQEEINKIATQQLKELAKLKKSGTITAIGIDGVYSGGAVYVIDKETGLVGGFYIEADEHSYSNGYHEMKLTLAWTDELPEIEYEAPSSDTKKKSSKKE